VAFDNAQNHSSASSSASSTTSASSTDTTAPSAPPNLRGLATTRASTYKVRLDWDGATDAGGSGVAGYKVYRDDTLISGSNPVTNRYYEDSTGTANTSYTYKVKTIDGASNLSGYSNASTVTTLRALVLSEDFNHPDNYYDDYEWYSRNNTLEREDTGELSDWLPSLGSQSTFAATIKVLGTAAQNVLYSGLTFWGTPGNGSNNCEDSSMEWTPWAEDTGFYRVYVLSNSAWGQTLVLEYWPECDTSGASNLGSATLAPSGGPGSPGVLKVDVTSSTRRIKVYWNGVLKIDFTDTDTGRANSGSLGLWGYSNHTDNYSIFDDLLVEN
jgi:hypothetical protein